MLYFKNIHLVAKSGRIVLKLQKEYAQEYALAGSLSAKLWQIGAKLPPIASFLSGLSPGELSFGELSALTRFMFAVFLTFDDS
jgi:hypothetical protein